MFIVDVLLRSLKDAGGSGVGTSGENGWAAAARAEAVADGDAEVGELDGKDLRQRSSGGPT
jgi:hypothetical protein